VDFTNATVTVNGGKGGGGAVNPWCVVWLGVAMRRRILRRLSATG
jgi:hypothetical protein